LGKGMSSERTRRGGEDNGHKSATFDRGVYAGRRAAGRSEMVRRVGAIWEERRVGGARARVSKGGTAACGTQAVGNEKRRCGAREKVTTGDQIGRAHV